MKVITYIFSQILVYRSGRIIFNFSHLFRRFILFLCSFIDHVFTNSISVRTQKWIFLKAGKEHATLPDRYYADWDEARTRAFWKFYRMNTGTTSEIRFKTNGGTYQRRLSETDTT